jgi:DNA (cytosine-5)-methyltransferase 1
LGGLGFEWSIQKTKKKKATLVEEGKTMNYNQRLCRDLKPRSGAIAKVVDLFAGCGGLSLGFEAAGFDVEGYENDDDAYSTYKNNLLGPCHLKTLRTSTNLPSCPILISGPPCQPFSKNGHQRGRDDERNGMEIVVAAIRRLQPAFWLIENVRGLLHRSQLYFEDVLFRLNQMGYCVEYRIVNAAHYGVPQNRERIIVVGHNGKFLWPKRSFDPVTAGAALGQMARRSRKTSQFLTRSMSAYIARYERASYCITPRDLRLEGPARTLTCRNLGGATGDMQRVRLPDGRRRRLSTREAARLQSFPDWFKFKGTDVSVFQQIGNAVPPLVAYRIALACRRWLDQ